MRKKIRRGLLILFTYSLVAGALIGLAWANLHHHSFEIFKHRLEFLTNDVLMVLFFALAAKEIREAMLKGGPLSSFRTAAMPVFATIGGMAGPAAIFILGALIWDQSLLRGWAVPTATDIAFSAVIAKAIFPKGHAAIPFLLTLAVLDDAGGLIILATCYSTSSGGVGAFVGLSTLAIIIGLAMKKSGARNYLWYAIPAAISWFGFHLGGIHPALSAVPIIWTMPHRRKDLGIFSFEELDHHQKNPDSLTLMEHGLKNPVQFVLGLFGLLNAGVLINGGIGLATWLVLMALVVGKPVGIFCCSMIGRVLGLQLPSGMFPRDLITMGSAAGIGFTVALFVSTVAFPAGPLQDAAKMGALLSIVSAAIALGFGALFKKRERETAAAAVRITTEKTPA